MVLPVFLMFLFAVIEFGHCFLLIHTMNSAACRAARAGIGEHSTSQDIINQAHTILNSAMNADHENVQITVKDASIFDNPSCDPSTINFDSLQDVDVADLPSQSLFMVRVKVPYSDVGILGPTWISVGNLYGQSVMRKE